MSNDIEKLVLDFLDHLEVEKNCSKLTIRNYHHYLRRFAQWNESHAQATIEKVDLKVIRDYRLYLSRYTDERGDGLSKVTQSYYIIALRSFLKWLAKNDFEVISAEKIDLPKGESRSFKFLSEEQLQMLLNAPDITDPQAGMRDKAILEMLFSTGLRVSELAKLSREKINFKTKEFGIIGKGGRARVVFLSDSAAHWLEEYFKWREDDWKPAFIRYGKNGAYLTPKHKDGEDMRLSVRSIQRIVEKYRKKAQIPVEITPHGLRHTFATDLLSHGAGLREVQEMLGHKNVATTQIYTHVTNPQLKNVHKKFHSGNEAEDKETD